MNVCVMDTLASNKTSESNAKMSIRAALCPFAKNKTKCATWCNVKIKLTYRTDTLWHWKPTYRIKMNVQLLTWRAYLLAVLSVTGWKTLQETRFSWSRITWCRNIVDPACVQSKSALANSLITSVKILWNMAFCSVFCESRNKDESGTHASSSPSKYMLVLSSPTVASKVPSDLKSFTKGRSLFSTYEFLIPFWTAWTLSRVMNVSEERHCCSAWHFLMCSFILRSDNWREKFAPRGHKGHLLQYLYDVPQPDIYFVNGIEWLADLHDTTELVSITGTMSCISFRCYLQPRHCHDRCHQWHPAISHDDLLPPLLSASCCICIQFITATSAVTCCSSRSSSCRLCGQHARLHKRTTPVFK